MNLSNDTSMNSVNPRMIMYENTGYRFTRRKQHLLNVHISGVQASVLKTGKTFQLQEPLIIDSQSDIYMDSFTTFNPGSAGSNANTGKQAFVMKIPEFNIRANSTDRYHYNAIIVPNEDSGGTNTHKVHKGRKMNFISTVNPMTLTSITVILTDLLGGSAFADNTHTVSIEFVIVSKEYDDKKTNTKTSPSPT